MQEILCITSSDLSALHEIIRFTQGSQWENWKLDFTDVAFDIFHNLEVNLSDFLDELVAKG